MRRARTMFLACLLVATGVGSAAAQQSDVPARRAQLERQVRERFARVVKQRLELTDEQLSRLSATNARYEGRRRALVEQERDIRIGLRRELVRRDSADQQRVSRLLDQMVSVQRERLQLLEQEQRDLSAFLTPVQRARYVALQEQMHRMIEDLRQQRPGRAPRPGGRRLPP